MNVHIIFAPISIESLMVFVLISHLNLRNVCLVISILHNGDAIWMCIQWLYRDIIHYRRITPWKGIVSLWSSTVYSGVFRYNIP